MIMAHPLHIITETLGTNVDRVWARVFHFVTQLLFVRNAHRIRLERHRKLV